MAGEWTLPLLSMVWDDGRAHGGSFPGWCSTGTPRSERRSRRLAHGSLTVGGFEKTRCGPGSGETRTLQANLGTARGVHFFPCRLGLSGGPEVRETERRPGWRTPLAAASARLASFSRPDRARHTGAAAATDGPSHQQHPSYRADPGDALLDFPPASGSHSRSRRAEAQGVLAAPTVSSVSASQRWSS